jgi:phosphonate transport system substrate-binding protein
MSRQPIRFVTFLAPNIFTVYQFVADYVAEKLVYPTALAEGVSFDQFAANQADVGFICGLPYVQLADQRPSSIKLLAAPVLQGVRYQDRPIYFSDVIVRRDSPFQTFADLRGCSWSYNDPQSHSGYNVTRYWLARLGETGRYFGRIVQAGFHQKSIRMVCTGDVDAAAIDSQVLSVELRDFPELAAQVRVVEVLGPSPIQPVVAARHVPDALASEIRAVLLAMGDDPAARAALDRGFVKRFEAVSNADYDPIRAMLSLAVGVDFAPRAEGSISNHLPR